MVTGYWIWVTLVSELHRESRQRDFAIRRESVSDAVRQPRRLSALTVGEKGVSRVSNEKVALIDRQLGERYPALVRCMARVVKARFDGVLSWNEYIDYVSTVSTRRSVQPEAPSRAVDS